MEVNFIHDNDSPEILEKTSFMKSKQFEDIHNIDNTDKSPEELERSVEEVETDGNEQDVDNDSSSEEDWEKLEEEADAAMCEFMSWMSETSGNEEGANESSRPKLCVNIVLDDNVSEMKELERCPSLVERIPLFHDPTLPTGWSRKVRYFQQR